MTPENEKKWNDPDAYYDGPIDHDVTSCGMELLAAFWTDSQALTIDEMRARWKAGVYRGLPPTLARDLMA